jgi:multicomponent Na+:H+ antiporter subunit B
MRTTTRVVVPFIVIVSLSLFVQGHNLPGGGFIAGVLTTVGFVLIYITFGLDDLERVLLGEVAAAGGNPFEDRIVDAYRRTFVFGLALAVGSGLAAMALGHPFLSQDHATVHGVPLYHEIEVASAVVFDLGIYCVVVGGLLTVLSVVGSE